ncbi:MAG: outer membrane beta-barrel protein [Capsulimonas sp.]|uniref:outer membrane beta-barrel protein n=1 Tax=Capsulimonas sp. TaxID=2494211 RepID=UPI00326694B9
MRTNLIDLKKFSTAAAVLLAVGMTVAPGMAQTPPTAPPASPDTTAPAPEQAPDGPAAPNYEIQYNGLVDGYLQYQFNNPKDSQTLTGRVYDVRHLTPALALAELNVFKNAKPGGLGFKATLIAGDTADINHGGLGVGGTGEGRWKNVQQLYGTYAFAGAGGGVDFGKFYTPYGYEVTESNANYNYSRSDVFGLLPFYHFGVRAYTPTKNGLTFTGYIVSAIIDTPDAGVQDDNKEPSFIGQVNYTDPGGKFVVIETLGGGNEKPFGVTTKALLSDTDFTYNVTSSSLVGFNYFYAKYNPDGADNDTTQNGYAVYFKQTLTPKTGFALRVSGFDSKTQGAPKVKPYEVTATYEYKAAANFLTRAEFRHDHSNIANTFLDGDGVGSKKEQDTFSVSGVFTF